MILIHPVVDFILGVAAGFAFYFQVTNSWCTVPILLRRLLGR